MRLQNKQKEKEKERKKKKKAKRSIEMHTRNPNTQLGGRGRKIRSPRLPSVTPSLRSASMHTRVHSHVHKGTHIDTTGAHICIPFMHLKRSWKRNVQRRISMKVLTTSHQRKPPRRLQFISFQYFPEQRLYTRKQVTHPLIFHQAKNSVCFYIVGETVNLMPASNT